MSSADVYPRFVAVNPTDGCPTQHLVRYWPMCPRSGSPGFRRQSPGTFSMRHSVRGCVLFGCCKVIRDQHRVLRPQSRGPGLTELALSRAPTPAGCQNRSTICPATATQGGVLVLRNALQHLEGSGRVDLEVSHQDALGLPDDVPCERPLDDVPSVGDPTAESPLRPSNDPVHDILRRSKRAKSPLASALCARPTGSSSSDDRRRNRTSQGFEHANPRTESGYGHERS